MSEQGAGKPRLAVVNEQHNEAVEMLEEGLRLAREAEPVRDLMVFMIDKNGHASFVYNRSDDLPRLLGAIEALKLRVWDRMLGDG